MKRAIICEGRTDVILLSYLLNRFDGWEYTKRTPLKIEETGIHDVLHWYENPQRRQEELAIWGGDGFSGVGTKLGRLVERSSIERESTNRFAKVALVFDSDDREHAEIAQQLSEWLASAGATVHAEVQVGVWLPASVPLKGAEPASSFGFQLVAIPLPPSGQGNLETFLLSSLKSASEHDQELVSQSEKFVDAVPSPPYVQKQRLKKKAQLGSALSVISPDWVFSDLDTRLKLVHWEEIKEIAAAYERLAEL